MITEPVSKSDESKDHTDVVAQQQHRPVPHSNIERVAAKIVQHLPPNAIDKLIDSIEDKLKKDEQDFDEDDLKDAIEVAKMIADLSNNEQVKVVAADLRQLGAEYKLYKEARSWGVPQTLLMPTLHKELVKLKADIHAISIKTLFSQLMKGLRPRFDMLVLWVTAKMFGIMLAIFLCFPKRQRMSHNNGIAAKGTFKVVANPKFPPHKFFSPNTGFKLRIRHASATFLDDAMNCIRSLSLKFADTQFKSDFDLQMNSGETSLFWSAASFLQFAKLRDEKHGVEYREYNRKYPDGLEASKIATRRYTPFEKLHYYCKTPFLYESSDGNTYYAKYRVIPGDKAKDTGMMTDRSDWDQCNQRVKDKETNGRNWLKYAYVDLVAEQKEVRYWLQIQTRLATDADTDPELCNNMVVWKDVPWEDVGEMIITETLDWRESTLTSFSVNNMPKGLGVIPATSIYDYNSLNYMRSHGEIAYKARKLSYWFFGMVPPIPDNDNRNVSDWGE